MELDERDLRTETFSNARGWTVVRVVHPPTELVAERVRSESLRSAVRAQRECVDELRRQLVDGDAPQGDAPVEGNVPEGHVPAAKRESRTDRTGDRPVTRSELDALAARVASLESQLARKSRRSQER